MSATTPVSLPGSTVDKGPLRNCNRCEIDKPRGGGIEVGPGRWNCADCWKQRRLVQIAGQRRRP
jgi:hypothetical protein